jgi:hypothetical protein
MEPGKPQSECIQLHMVRNYCELEIRADVSILS